ncbi:uncharacterized protein BDZ99DRAFT_403774, partial [Mytilinidion resinicola]
MPTENVILSSPTVWESWIQIIQAKAERKGIWGIIDPSKTDAHADEMLPEPTKPAPPAADDSTFAAQMTWKMTYDEYKDNKVLFDKQKESLQDLRIFILQTVDTKYTTYTYGISSARDLLAKLKKSIAPSDEARRNEIYNLWQKQKHYPAERTIEKWLMDWETLYSDASRLQLPEAIGNRAQIDFLLSLMGKHPEFAGYWRQEMIRRTDAKESAPSLADLVSKFRMQRHEKLASQGKDSHSAYATTLQGQEIKPKTNSPRALTPCLCGETHLWRNCPYICAKKRPTGWQMDTGIQGKVKKALEQQHPKNQERIRKMQEEFKGPTPGAISAFAVAFSAPDRSSTPPALFSTAPPYQLRNSVILDSGATTHVFNAAHWFTGNFEQTDIACYTGKGVESITGFGTAKIALESSNGIHYAMLSDSAYI